MERTNITIRNIYVNQFASTIIDFYTQQNAEQNIFINVWRYNMLTNIIFLSCDLILDFLLLILFTYSLIQGTIIVKD